MTQCRGFCSQIELVKNGFLNGTRVESVVRQWRCQKMNIQSSPKNREPTPIFRKRKSENSVLVRKSLALFCDTFDGEAKGTLGLFQGFLMLSVTEPSTLRVQEFLDSDQELSDEIPTQSLVTKSSSCYSKAISGRTFQPWSEFIHSV